MGEHDDLVCALIETNKKQQVHITDLLSILSHQQTIVQSLIPAAATSSQRGIRIPEKRPNPILMQSRTQLEPQRKDGQNATFDFEVSTTLPHIPSLRQRIEKDDEEIHEQSIDEIFEEAQKESEAKDKRIRDLEELVAELSGEAKKHDNTLHTLNTVEKHVEDASSKQHANDLNSQHGPTDDHLDDTQGSIEHSGGDCAKQR